MPELTTLPSDWSGTVGWHPGTGAVLLAVGEIYRIMDRAEGVDSQVWSDIEMSIRRYLGLAMSAQSVHNFDVHCNAEQNPPSELESDQVVAVISLTMGPGATFYASGYRFKVDGPRLKIESWSLGD